MKKLAIILPGTGYTKDKPLLHYASKIAVKKGYDVISVDYDRFFDGVNYRSKEEMNAVAGKAFAYATEHLDELDFDEYDSVAFIEKSFGTIVGARYAAEKGLNPYQIWYTPVLEAYEYATDRVVAFMGDEDPVAAVEEARKRAEEKGIPLHVYPKANHSIETGDVLTDIDILKDVMAISDKFLD